uniref:Ectonucleotide pyrophosphatase/phosphodiesterase family member 1 n=1 Tax=Cajanus cajan TaxID=3821 RepID=A0A151T030_CAJCA|nr:Ectonucleotide pyrophosphatase/phosphodiesterase family member 1 [Cajanus cajan]
MAEEPLLPRSSHSTSSSRLILIIASMSLAAAFILALYFSSTSSSLLPHPVVILISSDGFRFGYQHKTPTPNIHRLILHGTEALTGLIPVFPTLTFPNHYSIVTGLYPPHHGIINNFFFDPLTGEKFTMSTHDPKWWLGHPLWETVAAHNLTAATYFWPGSEGHLVGPDDSEITNAVSRIDTIIGRLIQGLEQRGVFDEKMNQGLNSGKVENGEKLRVFLKENLPERLHYSDSDRIPPIIGLVEEGYKVEATRTGNKECGGAHGYDNAFFSMRTIFIGRGPRFARGRKIPSFENVQIYNLVTSILNIQGAPNNGSASFPNSVLLPSA